MDSGSPIRVAITSIGSGVGQSIVQSCRLSQLPLETFGLGANPLAFGAHDCDHSDPLPSIYSDDYAEVLLAYCARNRIQILIPGLDDELPLLSRNESRFLDAGIVPVVTSMEVVELSRNKEKLGRTSHAIDRFFTRSYSKSEAMQAIAVGEISFPLIAKPRSGFASRGTSILREMSDLERIDDNKVIQQIVCPHGGDPNYEQFTKSIGEGLVAQVSEISIQIVMGHQHDVLGTMVTYNKLVNGVPVEIIPCSDKSVQDTIALIAAELTSLKHKGPVNIQGRVTDQGLKCFEMNARFTGITGLRAMYGFNEVEAVVRDFLKLNGARAGLSFNARRIGIRQVADRLVDVRTSPAASSYVKSTGAQAGFPEGLTVMVTGANGALGRRLVTELQQREDVGRIVAVVRTPDRFAVEDGRKLTVLGWKSLLEGDFSMGLADCIYHLGFTRQSNDPAGLAASLANTDFLMLNAGLFHTGVVINVSSQSVYGLSRPPLRRESDEPRPETLYAQAKYAAELLTNQARRHNRSSRVASVRLSTMTGPAYPESVVHKFGRTAFLGGDITIVGGKQTMDILDVRDATRALARMLDCLTREWKAVYNVGTGKSVGILDFAHEADAAARACGRPGARIVVKPAEIHLATGMDIGSFSADFNWTPRLSIAETYRDIYDHFARENR